MSKYSFYDVRLASFSAWPFEGNCSKEEMAKCGFYYTGCSDDVKCYYCSKELDGWEAEDIPYVEHEAHSPKCPLIVTYNQTALKEFITLKDALYLEKLRLTFHLEERTKLLMQQVEAMALIDKRKKQSKRRG